MTANLDKALPYYLKNIGAISALVSDRIRPNRLESGETIPAVVFELISTNPVQTHGDQSFLPRQRYQFTYYGVSYETCKNIGIAFKAALDGYQGNMGTGSFVTEIEACLYKDERSTDDPETGLFWRQQDYLIIWKE